MSAPLKDRSGVLSDSQAILRQMGSVLNDLGTPTDDTSSRADRLMSNLQHKPTGLQDLMRILTRTYSEIIEVAESLRESRGLLEEAAMKRLQNTHHKLAEVTSATEIATTSMLDGLDRALELVDDLDAAAQSEGGSVSKGEVHDKLRDELHQLMNLLQFQDITAQQLGYASGVLKDIEERMVGLAAILDIDGLGLEVPEHRLRDGCPVEESKNTCDPEASTLEAECRQALADEIFT